MNLRDKLKEETIILPIQATTQAGSIQELLIHLQNKNILSLNTKFFPYFDKNEKKSPSAAGSEIAYPHSTSTEVEELTYVLDLSKDGIDFNSPDGQFCHIILLTLSPDEDPYEYRKFITRFRTMIDNPIVRSRLLDANQHGEVIIIIERWEEEDALTYNLN